MYSRFTLHSISAQQEQQVIASTCTHLRPGGVFLIEARSRRDQMLEHSRLLSDCEGVTDHYRRFIDLERLLASLVQAGLTIEHAVESTGRAVHADEDPMVIRVVARRSTAGG